MNRVLYYFVFIIFVAAAQERPFVSVQKFTETDSYRTNVCLRQRLVYDTELELEDALRGLNLTVAITNYKEPNEASLFTLKNGKIKEEDPGLFVVLLDELAARAGFAWRNSFAAIDPINAEIDGNKTWTYLLEWEIDHFDIAADYWGHSAERMALGISFPKAFYDGSIILAQSRASSGTSQIQNSFWAFLLPFDGLVWLVIFASIAATGLSYFLLERLNVESDERELESKPAASIFLASIVFTGHFEFKPNTLAARLLSFSWSFCCLVLASAYTANLASFLVARYQEEFVVTTLDDATKLGTPVCLQNGSVMDEVITKNYPSLNIVRKATEKETFDALRQDWYSGRKGCGVTLTNLGTFQVYQGDKEVNADCSLTSEFRVIRNLPSGFATAVDTGLMCTSLVSHVLNIHLTEMEYEGFIDQAWQDHLRKIATIDCQEQAQEAKSEEELEREEDEFDYSLSLNNMAGIFILHGALTLVALAFALVDQLRTRYRTHFGLCGSERPESPVARHE